VREVIFTPTTLSWLAFLGTEIKSEPLIARADRRLTIAAGIQIFLSLPVFALSGLFIVRQKDPDLAFAGIAFGGIIWLLYAMYALPRGLNATRMTAIYKRWLANPSAALTHEQYRVSISIDGVTITQPQQTWTQSWSLFRRVVTLPDCLVFEHEHFFSSIVLPAASFSSPDELAAFAKDAESFMNAAGFSEQSQLSRAIDARQMKCPDCGYSMNGLGCSTCPECGRQCSFSTLRALDTLHKPLYALVFSRASIPS
jgi:rubrerythrin